MSGLSSIGSSLASSTSGTSSPSSSTSLLSQVGQSLLSTGQAPNATPSSATNATAPTPTPTLSSYQTEYLTLQQQDTAEILYASFLSPTAGLANADAVLGQAAQLLGTPGSLATAQSLSSSTPATSTGSTSSTSGSTSPGSTASSTSTAAATPSSSVTNLLGFPSVSSILSGSDSAAQQTLTAYGNAPAGSSIIDYQA